MEATLTASDLWAQTFVSRLLQLEPGLDLPGAITVCLDAFEKAEFADPEEAAEAYVAERAASSPGALE
jgi:hypothetical protein